jgi:NAD(P)-dependent dehydrogenase (short-subunit alcohol dehydrogenase family)
MTYYGAEKVGRYIFDLECGDTFTSKLDFEQFLIRLSISRRKGARSFGADIITVLERWVSARSRHHVMWRRRDAAAEMVKQTKDAFGRIDFLINNAGITHDTLILLMKEEDRDTVIDTTNLMRTFEIFKGLDDK